MFKFNKKKNDTPDTEITWDSQAELALKQAVDGAPVPKPLKGKMEKELRKAAQAHTLRAGRNIVTPEDLMNGLLAKLPDNMKNKVEQAMQQGPAGLKNLENDLKNN